MIFLASQHTGNQSSPMLRYWLALILGVFSACDSTCADPADEYVKNEMQQHRIPGVSLAVLQSNQVVKQASFGLASLELKVPVSPETVFEIGSITKQFTAACILVLVQDGKLSLDEKISPLLHRTPQSWSNITVRHLLTHTSGIKSYTGLDGFELRRHLTQEQFVHAIGAYPLETQPGHAWKYCNTGYNLLGFIIENVSGMDYWSFLQSRILRPLEMTSTTLRMPSMVITNRASGYEQTNHIWINRDYDLTDVFAAGALMSSIGDLAKWNNSLDNGVLLNAETRKQMWTPARLNNGTATDYGFGWRIEKVDGHSNIGHGGSTSGFSASLQRFPQDHLAVIVLTNTDEQIATKLARGIAALYFRQIR
jgi:CubicO group peptidase (beta-lactamase class C family)